MTEKKAIKSLKEHAARVFGSADEGNGWLCRENMFLAGKTPLGLAKEDKEGAERVSNLLSQMEYGVYP